RRAVRADHRLLQEGPGETPAAGPDARPFPALDAVPPDALRPPHALGAGPAAPGAETPPRRPRARDEQVDAGVAAAHAGDRPAAGAALRQAAGGAAGRGQEAGARRPLHRLRRRRVLPADDAGDGPRAAKERL